MLSPRDKFISIKDMMGKNLFFKGEGCRDGKAWEVYHSSLGFSWPKVACGIAQKISLKVFQDSKDEDAETKRS